MSGVSLHGLNQIGREIGASLEAEVDLYCTKPWMDDLGRLGGELRFLFIVSQTRIAADTTKPAAASAAEGLDGVWISVARSGNRKCERCWHLREDVGAHAAHPTICGRCVKNVDGPGEERQHA